jgi:hypothetical protein
MNSSEIRQQFLDFFQNRFVPGGLYLLDEPEAPLSPMRQLGMLALLKEMVAKGNETHQSAATDMQGRWKNPIKGMGWYLSIKRAFAAMLENS